MIPVLNHILMAWHHSINTTSIARVVGENLYLESQRQQVVDFVEKQCIPDNVTGNLTFNIARATLLKQ